VTTAKKRFLKDSLILLLRVGFWVTEERLTHLLFANSVSIKYSIKKGDDD